MEYVALVSRLVLALVFATAALGKFADRAGARQALADFRVPARAQPVIGVLLPLGELVAAVGLLFQPSARGAAVLALVLLALFAAAIAGAMARGEAPDCHCFGQISSAPAGRGTLLRNSVLAAPALLVTIYGPGKDLAAWTTSRSAAELTAVILGCMVVGAAIAAFQLWGRTRALRSELERAQGTLALFPPGIPVGAPAPSFELATVSGGTQSLAGLVDRGLPTVLVFVSPSCSPCRFLMPDVAQWQGSLSERLTIAVIMAGTEQEARDMAAEFGLSNVLIQREAEVFNAYRAAASPSVVVIGADGRVASKVRSSSGIVEGVIRFALANAARVPVAEGIAGAEPGDPPLTVTRWSGRGVHA